jgi:hypothetical protein
MKLDIHPLINSILLFVPGLGFILIYRQLKNIDKCAQQRNIQNSFYPPLVFLLWMVFLLESTIIFVIRLVTHELNIFVLLTFVVGLLSIAPLTLVQNTVNLIILTEQPNINQKKKMGLLNFLILLLGLCGWCLLYIFAINVK